MPRSSRPFAVASFALVLGACGGGGSPEPECGPGEGCACSTDFDCPDPFNERCDAEFGQEGICISRSEPDTGSDTDTADDAADDATDTSPPDVPGDPDVADLPEETSADAADTTPDVADTADTAPDTADAVDSAPDTVDPDTTDAADAPEDTTEDTDTDVGPPPGGYYGWIAVQTTAGSGLGAIHVYSGDRTVGPIAMPVPAGVAAAAYPDFAPDGERLAYAVTTDTASFVRIVTLASATWEDLFDSGEFLAVRAPRFSPDGGRLLFSARTHADPAVWNIFVVDSDDGPVTALTDLTNADAEDEFVSAGAWAHDGTRIYYVAGVPGESTASEADVWSMLPDGSDKTQVSIEAEVTSVVLSIRPDGSEMLYDGRAARGPIRRFIGSNSTVEFGRRNADSVCVYYGSSPYAVCARHQTADLAECVEGDLRCSQDAVVVSLETGTTVVNLSRDVTTRETFVAVTAQPYTALPLGEF